LVGNKGYRRYLKLKALEVPQKKLDWHGQAASRHTILKLTALMSLPGALVAGQTCSQCAHQVRHAARPQRKVILMRPEIAPVGRVWHTLFSTWKVEADEMSEVCFPFGSGFGCGATMKITQGEKFSLQTQYKAGGQVGAKLGTPGNELSAGLSSEISETIVHEFSVSQEWSHQSGRCEFCTPSLHFPNARVRILARWMLHLPVFASRRTVFLPGSRNEIRSHCRHAPDRCQGCEQEGTGSDSILTCPTTAAPTFLERVVHSDRRAQALAASTKALLKELLTTPDDETAPAQLHVVELEETPLVSDARYVLYPVDDLDRVLGSVRLYPGKNRIFLLSKPMLPGPNEPKLIVNVTDEETDEPFAPGVIKGKIQKNGYSLTDVELDIQKAPKGKEGLSLSVSWKESQTWPVSLVAETTKPGPR